MTPERQRIAIAEACGWIPCATSHLTLSERLTYGDRWWRHPEDKTVASLANLPDYLTDLNAMHEAEKVLVEHHGLYWFTLAEVVSGFKWEEFDYSNEYFLKDIACATAPQRAEAFLRTLNLYIP